MTEISYSLAAVIALILILAATTWYLRNRLHKFNPPKSKIVHASALDARHRLVILEYLDTEYVLVLGQSSFLIDKRPINPKDPSFSTHLRNK